MSPILLGEYRNQHGRRQYPFADDVTLTDADGQPLPTDFLLDAFMYPIDLQGKVYLSRIDLAERVIYFSDTVSNNIVGTATFETTDESVPVYEYELYDRQIGMLVFGDGLSALFRASSDRMFEATATELCPTAYIALTQPGVRGIVLEDGTLFTGDVTIEGQEGVEVTSYISNGVSILQITVVGAGKTPPDDCATICPIIEEICVERIAGSSFDVSKFNANTLAIAGHGFDLQDICTAKEINRKVSADGDLPLRPSTDCGDPCDPQPPTPPVPVPDTPVSFCFDVTDPAFKGHFHVSAPSTVDMTNAVYVRNEENVGVLELPRFNIEELVTSVEQTEQEAKEFNYPPFVAGGIFIGFRGFEEP